jgi:hypothetical protein
MKPFLSWFGSLSVGPVRGYTEAANEVRVLMDFGDSRRRVLWPFWQPSLRNVCDFDLFS